VHSLCTGLPLSSTPSTVTLMLSPADSYTTMVFLPALGGNLDFDSFSFQLPICGCCAIEITNPARQNARIKRMLRGLMLPPVGKGPGWMGHSNAGTRSQQPTRGARLKPCPSRRLSEVFCP